MFWQKALELIAQEKMRLHELTQKELSDLKSRGFSENSSHAKAGIEGEFGLEQAFKKMSVYEAFHGGISPSFTSGWQIAILAGVSPEIALANVKATDVDGNKRNMAHYAAWSGNLVALRYVYEHFPQLEEQLDNEQLSIIHYAAWSGHLEMWPLVEMGLNSENSMEIAKFASMSGNSKMLAPILDRYPDLYNQTYYTWSIAHFVGLTGDLEMMKLILEYPGENIFLTHLNDRQLSIAHMVALSGNIETFKYLLSKAPNLSSSEDEVWLSRLLSLAALSGHVEMLTYIYKTYNPPLLPNICIAAAVSRDLATLNYALSLVKSHTLNMDVNYIHSQGYSNSLENIQAALETNTTLTEIIFNTRFSDPARESAIEKCLKRNKIIQDFQQKHPGCENKTPRQLLKDYYQDEVRSSSFFNSFVKREKGEIMQILQELPEDASFTACWENVGVRLQSSSKFKGVLDYIEARQQVEIAKSHRPELPEAGNEMSLNT